MPLCLVGDIGGTNGRFAVFDGESLTQFRCFPCADYASFDALLEHYIAGLIGPRPEAAVFAVATHVSHDQVEFTNLHWAFSVSDIGTRYGFSYLKVLNDFTAVSLAVPHLRQHQLVSLGGRPEEDPEGAKAVMGPGTGLGVSGLLNFQGQWVPLQGQGGHIACGPANEFEKSLFAYIANKLNYVSAESLLSGRGIGLLYEAVLSVHGRSAKYDSIPAIVQAGIDAKDRECERTLAIFSNILGRVAGDLALTLGARGGVYIGGGVVSHLFDFITDNNNFRESFDNKGVMQSYMEAIPVFIISEPQVGLLGALESRKSIYDGIGLTKCSEYKKAKIN